jgi:Cu/Ag efflux protein CusF
MSKQWLRAVTTLSIAAIALAFAAPVRGQEAAPKPEKPKRHAFTGIIQSVDAAAGTVIVNKDKESKTFKVGDKTKYSTADKKEAALADLKAGDKVTVAYTEDAGVLTAHKIAPPESKKKEAK